MTTDRVARFKADMAGVNQPQQRISLLVGAQLLFGLGVLLALIAFVGSSYADDSRDQRDFIILTLLGLSLCIGGSAMYVRHSMTEFLRHWLARVLYEQQRADGTISPENDPGSTPGT